MWKNIFYYIFSTLQKQPPDVFCKKGLLKNSANFLEKHPLGSLFIIKRLQHRCFPLKFVKFLRAANDIDGNISIFKNIFSLYKS